MGGLDSQEDENYKIQGWGGEVAPSQNAHLEGMRIQAGSHVKKKLKNLDVMVFSCRPSIGEIEAGGSLAITGQTGSPFW